MRDDCRQLGIQLLVVLLVVGGEVAAFVVGCVEQGLQLVQLLQS